MIRKANISSKQAILLIVGTIFSTMLLYLPSFIFSIAKQDSWISVLIVILFGILVGNINARLGERFPAQTIIQYAPAIIGKILGKITGLIMIFSFILLTAIIVREFAGVISSIFMTETPLYVFILSPILLAAYTSSQGLEVLARANEITLQILIIILFFIIVMSIPSIDFDNITPVLEQGIYPVIKGVYPATIFFGEIFIISMLFPYFNKPREGRKIAFWGVTGAGLLLFVLMVAGILVFNCEASRIQFLALALARRVSVAEVIERLDPLIMLTWMGGLFIKTSVFYYISVAGLTQWLNLKSTRPIILIMGVVIGVMAKYLWPNSLTLIHELEYTYPTILTPLQIGIPLLLLLIAIIRGKGEKI